jgi:hypothetical protein
MLAESVTGGMPATVVEIGVHSQEAQREESRSDFLSAMSIELLQVKLGRQVTK